MHAARTALAAAALAASCVGAHAQSDTKGPSNPGVYGDPKWTFYFGGATFVASSNSINVPAGNYATVLFCNTSASKMVHIFRRRFDNNIPENVTAGFLYGGISGVTSTSITSLASSYSVSGPSSATTLSDLVNTYPASTNVSFSYAAGTTAVNGTIVATGYLPPSTPYELQEPRGLGPGTCQAQFAQNKSATTAYNVVLTIYWWEQ